MYVCVYTYLTTHVKCFPQGHRRRLRHLTRRGPRLEGNQPAVGSPPGLSTQLRASRAPWRLSVNSVQTRFARMKRVLTAPPKRLPLPPSPSSTESMASRSVLLSCLDGATLLEHPSSPLSQMLPNPPWSLHLAHTRAWAVGVGHLATVVP